MPDNGDGPAIIPVKTSLTRKQTDFVDSIIAAGDALSRSEAVRVIISRAMKTKVES